MGCCLNKNPGTVLEQEENTDREKSKHQLFMEAALDIKLVCLQNRSTSHTAFPVN